MLDHRVAIGQFADTFFLLIINYASQSCDGWSECLWNHMACMVPCKSQSRESVQVASQFEMALLLIETASSVRLPSRKPDQASS